MRIPKILLLTAQALVCFQFSFRHSGSILFILESLALKSDNWNCYSVRV